jgi:sulfur carrier protein
MQIIINGEPRDVGADLTIAQLLRELGITVRHVAVEVNQQLVPRSAHDERRLAPDDRLEVVTLVGGG